jgi:hypothetical protein
MRGMKTGGRKTGTPNKRTQEVQEKLAELKCDPIEGMAQIALDESNSPQLRGRMFAELAGYVAPKRRAVEVSGSHDAPPRVQIELVRLDLATPTAPDPKWALVDPMI